MPNDTVTKTEIIELLRQVSKEYSPQLATWQYHEFAKDKQVPSIPEIVHLFSSWEKAKEAAGLKQGERAYPTSSYSRQELLELLAKAKCECEGTLTCSAYMRWREGTLENPNSTYHSIPSYPTVLRRFSVTKWADVLETLHTYMKTVDTKVVEV